MGLMTGYLHSGSREVQEVSGRYAGAIATRAALAAITPLNRVDGMLAMVQTDGSLWRYVSGSVLTSDESLELAIEPTDGAGCWFRADKSFVMKLPISFATADAAALCTIPEGFVVRLTANPYWENLVAWTGGASSAIGISSNKASYNTKGDFLGGASGDVLAGLTAGIKAGTIGVKLDTLAEFAALLLVEGDAIRFDRITSAFTAGSGYVCIPVAVNSSGPATP
ncbi:MAG TPA: hypothetical protein VG734_26000 [Lacunisphaera sp.]|nr:hypothetical protein [Lacunisphaera sp.]